MFCNTSAPGIPLFLNRNKPAHRQGKLFLVNASQVAEKGDPKNFIPAASIERIATAFKAWMEEEKFAKIATREQVAREDYTIWPSRYVHIADAETAGQPDLPVGEEPGQATVQTPSPGEDTLKPQKASSLTSGNSSNR
jgi:type I restriction-modification system DNA methylase subunit